MTKPRIGFIGLGLMGRAMVSRLQDKGYDVTVLGHRDRSGVEAALERGGKEAASGREVAEASDIVMLCVGTSDQVESRMRGDDGVIAGLSDGMVVIDFGTSLPSSTRALGDEVAAKGAAYMDAPLGRTPSHAVDGLLNIMAAGDEATFEKVKPVLEDLGENIFHLGPLGSGHTIKLINNFFAMTCANAMAEGFAMADKAGVPRKALYDVLAAGPNHSGMMDFVAAYGLDGVKDKLAFSIRNATKDVGYYRTMAENLGAPSIISTGPHKALSAATEADMGDNLVAEMVEYYVKHLGD